MPSETFVYTRELPVPRERLYAIFTEAEHIAGASAPPGGSFVSETFELRVGGRHHYAMRTAEGQTTFGVREYTAIEPGARLAWKQSFSDASGARVRPPMAPAFPLVVLSTLAFEDAGPGATRITLTWEPFEATDDERAFFASIHAGMRGGWDATFAQIEAYAARLG